MESTNNIIEIKIDSYDDLVNHIKEKRINVGILGIILFLEVCRILNMNYYLLL